MFKIPITAAADSVRSVESEQSDELCDLQALYDSVVSKANDTGSDALQSCVT